MTPRPRILVVDDEPAVLDLVVTILVRDGYDCESATTAAELAERAEATRPDVVVTDIRLPDDDALGFLDGLVESMPTMPVILMSGHPSTTTAIRALRMEVVDYLVKPFSRVELLDAIDRALLRRRRVAVSPPEPTPERATFRAALEDHSARVLAGFAGQAPFVDRVRGAIIGKLDGGDVTLQVLSAALGMSSRTLQRRLQEFGTSHAQLLDEVRFALAKSYLADPRVSIGEIAYSLGYSKPEGFHRAFKRWTDSTPGAYRSSLDAAGDELRDADPVLERSSR